MQRLDGLVTTSSFVSILVALPLPFLSTTRALDWDWVEELPLNLRTCRAHGGLKGITGLPGANNELFRCLGALLLRNLVIASHCGQKSHFSSRRSGTAGPATSDTSRIYDSMMTLLCLLKMLHKKNKNTTAGPGQCGGNGAMSCTVRHYPTPNSWQPLLKQCSNGHGALARKEFKNHRKWINNINMNLTTEVDSCGLL